MPCSELEDIEPDIYWTAKEYHAQKSGAWVVNFRYGSLYVYNKLYNNRVRLVSGVYQSRELIK
jgi:hypothetical protein